MISRASLGFVLASVVYLVVGMFLGVYMFAGGDLANSVWIHAHLLLLGFVGMMIFGVAYHALPRFVGAPLHSDRVAETHLVLGNAALVGMVLALPTLGRAGTRETVLVALGTLEALTGLLFLYNVGMTVRAAR